VNGLHANGNDVNESMLHNIMKHAACQYICREYLLFLVAWNIRPRRMEKRLHTGLADLAVIVT
jgi:hypothetical protein